MSPSKLSRFEVIALIGGALLIIGMFLPWYEAVSELAVINGEEGRGSYSGWETHAFLRWLWLASAVAPFVLVYIVLRGHELSWARGEMTALISLIALVLVIYMGVIDRPGEPKGQIELEPGWYVSAVGVILMAAGSALRTTETERERKPPGEV